ncbi:biotin-dependent carboxyltransferase family protein [Nocardia sp. NPDC059246]|uniref:5-oxoprolinase subunit C family protein n=1 Tax=unclassified Nocardia TaxID=2637762 RepID=UPI0036A90E3E
MTIIIHRCRPQTLIQDHGRAGLRRSGVGASGAADRASFDLANRMVGNAPGTAGIECLLGGLTISTDATVAVAVTGADAPLTIAGTPHPHACTIWLHPGQTLQLGTPTHGLRTYVAVRGGVEVEPVLGSRSCDTLSGLGPAPLSAGAQLPIGNAQQPLPPITLAPICGLQADIIDLRALRGPRDGWFKNPEALELGTWQATTNVNRIGLRLDRTDNSAPMLERSCPGELPTEAVAPGSIQIPPSGQPVIFLADHPVTGGYPVIAVLAEADIDSAAQIRPGQRVRIRLLR